MSEKNQKKRMQGYKHNKVRRSQNKAGRTTLRIIFANVQGKLTV